MVVWVSGLDGFAVANVFSFFITCEAQWRELARSADYQSSMTASSMTPGSSLLEKSNAASQTKPPQRLCSSVEEGST
jgi:hypothetical protein